MVNSPRILRKPSQNSLPSSLALTLKWPLARGEVVLLGKVLTLGCCLRALILEFQELEF